tara:strand:+ start:1958 stop:2812 length:855 start_codon:yes stop_codon:yes gene_type:complete
MNNKIIINEKQIKLLTEDVTNGSFLDTNIVRAYSFDWDDNIINMPTTIKVIKNGEKIEVPTDEYANIRNNPEYTLGDDAFDNFISDDKFLSDLEEAIKTKSFAPSFNKFKEALIFANPISIITARGHDPKTLRRAMDIVISSTFSEDELSNMLENIQERMSETENLDAQETLKMYLDSHDYHPVTSEIFAEKFGLTSGSASNPEQNKKIAFRDYVEKIIDKTKEMVNTKYNKLSIGFSDDDLGNIKVIEGLIEDELKHEFPNVRFTIYDTSDGGNKKIVIKQVN